MKKTLGTLLAISLWATLLGLFAFFVAGAFSLSDISSIGLAVFVIAFFSSVSLIAIVLCATGDDDD